MEANPDKDWSMTDDAQGTQKDTDLNREAPTPDVPADENLDLGEEGVTADYETRMREFDNVESTPVVSLPVESHDLDESDLKL
jgi:hypothetical protein